MMKILFIFLWCSCVPTIRGIVHDVSSINGAVFLSKRTTQADGVSGGSKMRDGPEVEVTERVPERVDSELKQPICARVFNRPLILTPGEVKAFRIELHCEMTDGFDVKAAIESVTDLNKNHLTDKWQVSFSDWQVESWNAKFGLLVLKAVATMSELTHADDVVFAKGIDTPVSLLILSKLATSPDAQSGQIVEFSVSVKGTFNTGAPQIICDEPVWRDIIEISPGQEREFTAVFSCVGLSNLPRRAIDSANDEKRIIEADISSHHTGLMSFVAGAERTVSIRADVAANTITVKGSVLVEAEDVDDRWFHPLQIAVVLDRDDHFYSSSKFHVNDVLLYVPVYVNNPSHSSEESLKLLTLDNGAEEIVVAQEGVDNSWSHSKLIDVEGLDLSPYPASVTPTTAGKSMLIQ